MALAPDPQAVLDAYLKSGATIALTVERDRERIELEVRPRKR